MQRQNASNVRNKERALATNIGNLNMSGGPIVGPGLELIGSAQVKLIHYLQHQIIILILIPYPQHQIIILIAITRVNCIIAYSPNP